MDSVATMCTDIMAKPAVEDNCQGIPHQYIPSIGLLHTLTTPVMVRIVTTPELTLSIQMTLYTMSTLEISIFGNNNSKTACIKDGEGESTSRSDTVPNN
jgi:hypothetical protein